MLERVPEHGVMESAEEARAYASMDNEESNASFFGALCEHGCDLGEVLDLGTGPADIPVLLVKANPDVLVTGVDLSNEMLKIARLRIAKQGLSRRIRFMLADAEELAFADHQFDAVYAKAVLHHVSDPVRFLREIRRLKKPGGAMVIRDLFRPDSLARCDELVALHAAQATEIQRKLFYDSLRAAYSIGEVREFLDTAGLGEAQIAKTSDRHMTIWIDRS